jgi:sodium transport system permease protein
MIQPSIVGVLFRKDLTEAVRDSRTLLFVLAVPIISVLAMSALGGWMVRRFVESTALARVTVVATPEARAAYEQLAHEAFLGTRFGQALSTANHPFLRLALPAPIGGLLTPTETVERLFNDPAAYAEWARSLATLNNPVTGFNDTLASSAEGQLDVEGRRLAADLANELNTVVLQGIGLIDWRTPDEIVPSEEVDVPDDLHHHPFGVRIATALHQRIAAAWLDVEGDASRLRQRPWSALDVRIHHDVSRPDSMEAARRMREVMRAAEERIVTQRLRSVRQNQALLTAVRVESSQSFATPERAGRAVLAGLIPYFILLFAYIGGVFPAIDLGAGEKERNTLETLLLAPISRLEIALGKFLVVLTTSWVAALIGLVCMALAMNHLIPEAVRSAVRLQLSTREFAAMALLAIPTSCIFAGVFLGVTVFARSFKEAQNYLSPVGIVLTLPPLYAMMPWAELTPANAAIPLVGSSLLLREVVLGNWDWSAALACFGGSAALAALCLVFCVWQFHREEVLLRS